MACMCLDRYETLISQQEANLSTPFLIQQLVIIRINRVTDKILP